MSSSDNSFSAQLRDHAHDLWEAGFAHPFVQGIGRGDLDLGKFKFYLAQDYVYLIDYCRFFALGLAKAPQLETMRSLSGILDATLKTEMDLHRSLCAGFGISAEELEATRPAPECLGYTSYLLRTAHQGDTPDFFAALLPCMWGYHEIGTRLQQQGPPDVEHYRDWIATYASDEFGDLAAWCREWIDNNAGNWDSARKERLRQIFYESSLWEYKFWQMAWRGNTDPAG